MSAVKPVAAADRCTISWPGPAQRYGDQSAQRIKIKALTANFLPNQDEFSASSSLF
ncbi:hypothetical protein N5J07_06460 [Comamonas aquatica]|uniref:hypothetical protein n=1 Tax=Comamonas aquatica TaxID=225991 RepID=UPI00244AAE73|nr:hypothetical protein [Comamonas aquatica]MDH1379103.1 hypothetical protein [Comamonas aquatica]MDH1640771.1 hypothetical protein [Comamonas aquatica]